MALDLTSFDPILKSHYVKKRIWALAEQRSPFYSEVPRNKKAGGKHIVQPVDFANPSGGSATIAKAITNSGASKYEDFVLTRTKNYQVAYIDNETIHASLDDENAFLPALKEISKAMKAAGARDAWQIYRTKGGSKGQVANTTYATTALTLTDKADAFNFQVGEVVTFDTVDGGGTEHAGTLSVAGINRQAGILTMSANLATVDTGAIATNDHIFAEGDYGLNMAGLASWLPSGSGRTAALAASYYGVTRSVDSDRLGGIYRDATGEPIDEAVQQLVAEICQHGGAPDRLYMNPLTFSDLQILVGSKSRYDMVKITGQAQIGFDGMAFMAGGRRVVAVADHNCPTNLVYALQLDTWTLHSAGENPMFLDRDGLLQRSSNADTYEVRVGGYRNLGCSAPGYNGVAKLA